MITLSIAALIDLDDIYDFHVSRNRRYAEALNASLRAAIRSLAEHPERGTAVPLAPRPLRRIIERDHLIIYEWLEGEITVARVIYGARDIAALLSDKV